MDSASSSVVLAAYGHGYAERWTEVGSGGAGVAVKMTALLITSAYTHIAATLREIFSDKNSLTRARRLWTFMTFLLMRVHEVEGYTCCCTSVVKGYAVAGQVLAHKIFGLGTSRLKPQRKLYHRIF